MVRRISLIVLILLTPQVAQCADKWSKISFGAATFAVGTAGADAYFTYKAVKLGVVSEANPVLKPLVKAHGIKKAMITKVGFNVGTELIALWISHRWPEHRKTIAIANLVTGSVNGTVLVLNKRTLDKALQRR